MHHWLRWGIDASGALLCVRKHTLVYTATVTSNRWWSSKIMLV